MNDQQRYTEGARAILEALKSKAAGKAATAEAPGAEDPLYDAGQLEQALLVDGRAVSLANRLRATAQFDRIDFCPDCDARLGLPAPLAGRPTETWRCAGCHAVVVSGVTDDVFAERGVAKKEGRSTPVVLEQLAASQPAAIHSLVRQLSMADYIDRERRQHPRYPVSLPAMAVPLDDLRRVVRTPIRITTRDVSLSGLSAFSETPLPTTYVLVDFTPAGYVGWQAAVKVIRQRTAGFLNEFAGGFIAE